MATNGSDGIPLNGKTEEYATELWLQGPSAFWLHPEGPLSDTTPEEWLAKKEAERLERLESSPVPRYAPSIYANAGMQQSGLMAQYQNALHQTTSANLYGNYLGGLSQLGLSGLLGRL